MSVQHAKAAEVISLRVGNNFPESKSTTLAKTDDLELIRLVLPAGKEIPTHKVAGEITVQCLEGRVVFTAGQTTRELVAGQLLYLLAGEPHAVKALEDSTVLVTLLLKPKT